MIFHRATRENDLENQKTYNVNQFRHLEVFLSNDGKKSKS